MSINRATFRVDADVLTAFQAFLKEKKFTYKTDAELALEKLEGIAKDRNFDPAIFRTMATLRSQLQAQHGVEFDLQRDLIAQRIGTEVAAKLWGSEGRYTYALQYDPQVLTALDILKDRGQYRQRLSAQTPERKVKAEVKVE